MRRVLPVLLALACAAPPASPGPSGDTDPPGPSAPALQAFDDTVERPPAVPAIPLDATVSVRPHPEHPLMVRVEVASEVPCDVTITVDGPGLDARVEPATARGTHHQRLVAGLRPGATYTVDVQAVGTNRRELAHRGVVSTGLLPFVTPRIQVDQAGDPGGVVLLGVEQRQGWPDPPIAVYLALDAEGRIVWFLRDPDTPAQTPVLRVRDERTFFLTYQGEGRIVDLEGTILRRWTRGEGDDSWHHDAVDLPDGHMLALASETQRHDIEGMGAQNLVGDTVLEYDRSSRVVRRWSALDTLDPQRFPTDLSLGPAFGGLDWSHGNAVTPTPDGLGYVVSLRHQHWIVRVDRATAEVDWVMGPEGDWTLTSGTWFDAQHHPVFVGDDELFVYDNGNERVLDGGLGSRVVRYRLDRQARTMEEVWAWDLPVFTPFVGAVQPWGDDVLVVGGGREDGGSTLWLVRPDGSVRWSVDIAAMVFRAELVEAL